MKKYFNNQDGGVIVLFTIMLVCLIGLAGLVVDVGYAYAEKAKMQNVIDAAVLAGVKELPGRPDDAVDKGKECAEKNGIGADITRLSIATQESNRVLAGEYTKEVPTFFAKVFNSENLNNFNITVKAKARIFAVNGYTGVVPLGIEMPSGGFVYGQQYILKEGGGGGTYGNFGALDFSGRGGGAREFRDVFANGYDQELKVGDIVDTKPGNMHGPTTQAVDQRIADSNKNETFATVQAGSKRIIVLPVVENMPGTGNGKGNGAGADKGGTNKVKITGFVAMFLEPLDGHNGQADVVGKFIKIVLGGEQGGNLDYGVYTSALIE